MEGDNPDLPEDTTIASLTRLPEEVVIGRILTRFPIQDLIRFRRDCEFWKALFKRPDFLHEHLCSSHQNPYLVFKGIDLYWRPLRLYKPDQGMRFDEVPIPPEISDRPFRASYIDSSNGLLCIELAGPTPIVILWNPVISEWRVVDFGLECKSFQDVSIKMGFGFSNCKVNDCKVNDCKVVFIISDFTEGALSVHQVAVYSLRTSSWKEVQSGNLLDHVKITSYGKTINGAIYFKSNGHLLVSYDIAKEEFALISLPDSPEFNDSLHYSVEVHEKKLALLSYTTIRDRESSRICLWVREVGGQRWIVKHRIERPFLTRPATIWKNEIVCQFLHVYAGAPQPERESLDAKIVLANPTKDAGNDRSFDVSKHGSGVGMLNYVPSFVPVNITNNSPDEEETAMLL